MSEGSGPTSVANERKPAGEVPYSDPVLRSARGRDVAAKHQRVAEFLEDEGYDAVLLRRHDSFAWFTAGGDNGAALSGEPGQLALFITRE
ncbi:MAG TPA: hypothetical protein EYP14_00750, partial [Planctomycetaceae bacterium]|nr:hypothetical protein [Planctomycetaceae bacterium]